MARKRGVQPSFSRRGFTSAPALGDEDDHDGGRGGKHDGVGEDKHDVGGGDDSNCGEENISSRRKDESTRLEEKWVRMKTKFHFCKKCNKVFCIGLISFCVSFPAHLIRASIASVLREVARL